MPNWFRPPRIRAARSNTASPRLRMKTSFWAVWTGPLIPNRAFMAGILIRILQAPPVYNPSGLGLLTTTSAGNWERVQAMVLGHTWSLSPTTINSAHLSWTRLRDNRGTDPGVPDVTSVGVINPDGSKLPQLSPNFIYVSASNYFSSGCGTCAPAFFNRNTVASVRRRRLDPRQAPVRVRG